MTPFFDTSVRNLVIIDDLMNDACATKSVSELFTEGSHHRNLSVINLTQDLFPRGKQSTTQRRNTQYLVLFKSPMGQDQIQTIAKFMFPGSVKEFMRIYHQATSRPFGHLVVDTIEALQNRLKTDIFSSRTFQGSSEGEDTGDSLHKINLLDCPRDQTSEKREKGVHINAGVDMNFCQTSKKMSKNTNMAHSCDDCGTLFDTSHDLQQHVKNWCPEREPPLKVRRTDQVVPIEANVEIAKSPPVRSSESELGIFRAMLKRAESGNRAERKYKIKKYMDQGLDQAHAVEKADKKLVSQFCYTH